MSEPTLFFGVYDPREKGHFLYLPRGRSVWGEQLSALGLPRSLQKPDGEFCLRRPRDRWGDQHEAPQGVAALRFVDGWTVLAFWDRSGDSRGASNSNFLARGRVPFAEMVARAKADHPTVWARFPFVVTLEGPDLAPEAAP
jgi:hypothetical protein